MIDARRPRTLLTMSDQGSDQASLVRAPRPGPTRATREETP